MKSLKSTKFLVIIISALLLATGIVGITASAESSTPSLEIYSKNLSYGGTISIAFAVDARNVEASEVELLIYNDDPAVGTKADYAVDAFEATIVHDRAALVFLTPGIAAKDMTKQIYVKAHAVVDGVDVYSETERYSIAEYAYDMQYRSKINDKFIKLGESLLEVGEQIQALLPYNEDSSPLDFYYVAAEGGTVDGKYAAGLFKAGENITLNYNGEIPEGKRAVWRYNGNKVSNGQTIKAAAHAVYEVTFEDSYDKYLPGAFYNDASKEGTRYADEIVAAGSGKTVGIANNALGTFNTGVTYVIETDFTFGGGTPIKATDMNAAFIGLQMNDNIHNDDMFVWAYVTYLDTKGSGVSILGAELLKNVTYNLRFEYTVGDGSSTGKDYLASCLKFYVNGVEIEYDKSMLNVGNRASAGSDKTFWGLAIKNRNSSYNSSDLSITFDNSFISPKATLPDGQIESYYSNTSIDGTRYSYDEGTDGVATYNTHNSNKGAFGAVSNANGALKVANNPRWYGFAFLNKDYVANTTYGVGTQFIFEADVTLNSYTGVTEANPAFIGFFGETTGTLTNSNMYSSVYATYDFTGNELGIFGAKVGTGKTVKVTLVYTVGGSAVDVYTDGNFVGTSSCGSGTNFYGFGFYVRGTAGTSDMTKGLDMTFDNVFLGVIEAK